MKSTRTWLGAFVALALVAGCQQAPEAEETGTIESTPDITTIAAALDAHNDQFAAAWNASDGATLATLYTEDAVVLPPNATRVEGHAAIADVFNTVFDVMGETSLELTNDIVEPAGDIVYAVGTYHIAGGEIEDTGKYVAIFNNVDGEWKLAVDTWNSDLPIAMEGGE